MLGPVAGCRSSGPSLGTPYLRVLETVLDIVIDLHGAEEVATFITSRHPELTATVTPNISNSNP